MHYNPRLTLRWCMQLMAEAGCQTSYGRQEVVVDQWLTLRAGLPPDRRRGGWGDEELFGRGRRLQVLVGRIKRCHRLYEVDVYLTRREHALVEVNASFSSGRRGFVIHAHASETFQILERFGFAELGQEGFYLFLESVVFEEVGVQIGNNKRFWKLLIVDKIVQRVTHVSCILEIVDGVDDHLVIILVLLHAVRGLGVEGFNFDGWVGDVGGKVLI